MTETQIKLKDAATQMKLAIANSANPDIFRSCINSYISAVRSVTLLIQTESSHNPNLAGWYDRKMDELKTLPVMKFFYEKRTFSIHHGVVKPTQKYCQVHDIKYDGIKAPGVGTMSMWVFDDFGKFRPGDNGNVFRLCEEYFIIIKQLVHDWLEERTGGKSK
jgi:hypothetical protein